MKLVSIICSLFIATLVQAQKISNSSTSQDKDGKIIISYDLKDSLQPSKFYVVKIYSSIDNFKTPLNYVTGDVGDSVVLDSTKSKKIVWDMRLAYPSFDQEVVFQIRASKNVPLAFTNVFAKSYKSKNKLRVEYVGYRHNTASYFKLVSKKDTLDIFPPPSDDNRTDCVIPAKIRKNTYSLMLVNPAENQLLTSSSFVVKKKRNLLIKVGLPLVILGLVGYIVASPKPSSTTTTETTPVIDDSLITPPLPQ